MTIFDRGKQLDLSSIQIGQKLTKIDATQTNALNGK